MNAWYIPSSLPSYLAYVGLVRVVFLLHLPYHSSSYTFIKTILDTVIDSVDMNQVYHCLALYLRASWSSTEFLQICRMDQMKLPTCSSPTLLGMCRMYWDIFYTIDFSFKTKDAGHLRKCTRGKTSLPLAIGWWGCWTPCPKLVSHAYSVDLTGCILFSAGDYSLLNW